MEPAVWPQAASGREQSARGASAALIVALIGLPGAGKSTVARVLERELGLRRVCRDAIRHAMFPRCEYSFVEKRAAFRTLLLAVEINCLLGEASVIDGMTFSRREDFDAVSALAEAHGFDLLPLWIDCPPALARERIARDRLAGDLRGSAHVAEDRVPEIVDLVARRFESPPPTVLRIDAAMPIVEVCRAALLEVSARLDRAAGRARS